MTITLVELEQQARQLSVDDRARLAELLLESLHDSTLDEIEAAWELEIEQRVAALERGEVKTFSAEDVLAEARQIGR